MRGLRSDGDATRDSVAVFVPYSLESLLKTLLKSLYAEVMTR